MDSVRGGCVCEILREIKPRERMCVHSVQAREANGARWIHRVSECLSNIERSCVGYKESTMGSVFVRQRDIARDKCVCVVQGVYVT
jgi:hypothetical protein